MRPKILGIIASVMVIALILIFLGSKTSPLTSSTTQIPNNPPVTWEFDGQNWVSRGTHPPCPSPMTIKSPLDLARVQGILYPGQIRGGDYKPHGGFKLNGKNAIDIHAPLDTYLISGSRYLERGEVQYLLFFVHPCGLAYRFDHLLTLTPKLQQLFETLPPAKVDDSRTTNFQSPVFVASGELIATEIGLKNTQNTGIDFGVYDLRQPNPASQNSAWASQHKSDASQSLYAVCWLDWLAPAEQSLVKSLPGVDGLAGKSSDYCDQP